MRRGFDALRILGSAVALYLAASASATWAGAEILADAGALPSEPAPSRVSRPRPASTPGRMPTVATLDYNPFCPECVPETESEVEVPIDPNAPFVGATQTELPLELVATMEAAPPGRSIATLAGPEGTGAFAAGDRVLPGVRLARVQEGAVLLQRGAALEYLEMGAEPAKPKKLSPRPKPTTERRRPWELEGARDAVECNGWTCTVERSFIESLTRNPAQLASQARVRPYARDGLRGFRFSRVRTGTLPQLLGLRSGDVVTEVNGRHLETMDAALAMASRLRTSSHLSIGLTRNRGGERLPLRLEIQIVS